MANDLGDATDSGNHHRYTHEHGLNHRAPHRLEVRRERKDISSTKQVRYIVPKTKQMYAGLETPFADSFFDLSLQVPFSNHDEVSSGVPFADAAKRLHHPDRGLLILKAPNLHD